MKKAETRVGEVISMNQTLILLLITLVQCQTYGAVLPGPNSNDRIQDSLPKDWDPTDWGTFSVNDFDVQRSSKRSITNDALTRRSALDKNFMRFGRGGGAFLKNCGRDVEEKKHSFYRFGRGLKDGFIRFGRGGGGGGKDGFIRFGRTVPEDFFRAGRSLRENFIRFAKTDKNFMRFGRENADEGYQDFFPPAEGSFQRLGKSSRTQDSFLRFGKTGKNGTNFLRFGRGYQVESDPDANALREGRRRRRSAQGKLLESKLKSESKRSTGFFEAPSDDFLRRVSPVLDGSWQILENLKNSRLTPFFPVYSNQPKGFGFYELEPQRNEEESNFTKFG